MSEQVVMPRRERRRVLPRRPGEGPGRASEHLLGLGASCNHAGTNTCKLDLWCDAPTTLGTGTCVNPSPASGRCLGAIDQSCAAGLFCDAEGPFQLGTCEAPLGVGSACFTSRACQEGLYCGYDAQTSSAACKAQKAAGDSCVLDAFDECERGSLCDEGRCAPLYCAAP